MSNDSKFIKKIPIRPKELRISNISADNRVKADEGKVFGRKEGRRERERKEKVGPNDVNGLLMSLSNSLKHLGMFNVPGAILKATDSS